MVERTQLEIITRNLVAYDILKSPLSSLYQKAGRRQKKSAQEAAELVGNGEIADRVYVSIEEAEQEKSRTLRQGIDAFKKAHPRYGKVLEGMIAEKRIEKNQVLVYGIEDGFRLGSADYIRVMKDIGLSERAAHSMYSHLLEVSEQLGKADETGYREILL